MNELKICGNCKYYKQHGVMGFDGYSEQCFNPDSPYYRIDLSFDCECSNFEQKIRENRDGEINMEKGTGITEK